MAKNKEQKVVEITEQEIKNQEEMATKKTRHRSFIQYVLPFFEPIA